MAKTLYFTRHGETFWNVENKICGATDIALTPKGEEQAAALGRRLREMALPIDLVLASPPLPGRRDRPHPGPGGGASGGGRTPPDRAELRRL